MLQHDERKQHGKRPSTSDITTLVLKVASLLSYPTSEAGPSGGSNILEWYSNNIVNGTSSRSRALNLMRGGKNKNSFSFTVETARCSNKSSFQFTR